MAKTSATSFGRGHVYSVRLQFHPPTAYPAEADLAFEEVVAVFKGSFIPK